MQNAIRHVYLVFLFLGVLFAFIYFIPYVWEMFSNVSYQFVLVFLLIILGSNMLAKIANTYVNS